MAKGPSVERTRRAFVPDEAWLAKQAKEPILEPDLPIVDPHHHLWDHANHRYLLDVVARHTGFTSPVAVNLDEFYVPLLKAARGRPVGETGSPMAWRP
jgi:hypothetical protein